MKIMNLLPLCAFVIMGTFSNIVFAGGGPVSQKPSTKQCNSGIDGNRDCAGSESPSSSSSFSHRRPAPLVQVACRATVNFRILTETLEIHGSGSAISGKQGWIGGPLHCNYTFPYLWSPNGQVQVNDVSGKWLQVQVGNRKFIVTETTVNEVPGFGSAEIYEYLSRENLLPQSTVEFSENFALVPNI